jgi:hypothetical protein
MLLKFTLALGSTKNPTKQVLRTLSWGYGQGIKLTTYTYLVLRFNSQWSYTSTSPHTFMVCTGTTLPFLYSLHFQVC